LLYLLKEILKAIDLVDALQMKGGVHLKITWEEEIDEEHWNG
jgi:hypothetical protein